MAKQKSKTANSFTVKSESWQYVAAVLAQDRMLGIPEGKACEYRFASAKKWANLPSVTDRGASDRAIWVTDFVAY